MTLDLNDLIDAFVLAKGFSHKIDSMEEKIDTLGASMVEIFIKMDHIHEMMHQTLDLAINLSERSDEMTTEVNDILALATAQTTVVNGLTATMDAVLAKLAALAEDPIALRAAIATFAANNAGIAAAIAKGTVAVGEPEAPVVETPAPVETPVEETPAPIEAPVEEVPAAEVPAVDATDEGVTAQ
jgi:hypothetical protein